MRNRSGGCLLHSTFLAVYGVLSGEPKFRKYKNYECYSGLSFPTITSLNIHIVALEVSKRASLVG